MADLLWLSLGENCLPDDILNRHGKKSFSSPYASGRSNIDYALDLERVNYEGLLQLENLAYENFSGMTVVRSKIFKKNDDIFDASVTNGFEFTHHDPLGNESVRETLQRRIDRMILARTSKENDIVFLYHHRSSSKSNLISLRKKLVEYRNYYCSKESKAIIALLCQNIIPREAKTKLTIDQSEHGVIDYTFHTHLLWAGTDNDVLFARQDDGLLKEMLADIDGKLLDGFGKGFAACRNIGKSSEDIEKG